MTGASDVPDGTALTAAFFARDTVTVARDLLGKVLVSRVGETVTGGRIVETEAYLGSHDPGSHAATKGITARNAVMYGPPGKAYVYFTYGNHHMLNLVTEADGTAGAVLVRAIEPTVGVREMLGRRERGRRGAGSGRALGLTDIANGPGKVAAALGVDLSDNGIALGMGRLVVYEAPPPVEPVRASGRIGLSSGHELDLRFYLQGNSHVSRGRVGPLRSRARREGGAS